jgi:hypothetical protein
MEPNKLERQIRETLNSREIQPSNQTWDRLDAMLTVVEQPKKKFPLLWIAASFMGFVFVGTFLLYQKNENTILIPNSQNTVVETKSISPIEPKKEAEIVDTEINNTISKPIFNHKKISIITTNKSIIATKEIDNSKENQLVENQHQEISSQIPNQPIVIENQVSEITVETKLPIQVSTIKIDPTSLLSQVDDELKTEYRDNVFEKISKKYKTIKTAVAERNFNK